MLDTAGNVDKVVGRVRDTGRQTGSVQDDVHNFSWVSMSWWSYLLLVGPNAVQLRTLLHSKIILFLRYLTDFENECLELLCSGSSFPSAWDGGEAWSVLWVREWLVDLRLHIVLLLIIRVPWLACHVRRKCYCFIHRPYNAWRFICLPSVL